MFSTFSGLSPTRDARRIAHDDEYQTSLGLHGSPDEDGDREENLRVLGFQSALELQ